MTDEMNYPASVVNALLANERLACAKMLRDDAAKLREIDANNEEFAVYAEMLAAMISARSTVL